MSANELYQRLGAEQIRHLVLGPYDYERKLEGDTPSAPADAAPPSSARPVRTR